MTVRGFGHRTFQSRLALVLAVGLLACQPEIVDPSAGGTPQEPPGSQLRGQAFLFDIDLAEGVITVSHPGPAASGSRSPVGPQFSLLNDDAIGVIASNLVRLSPGAPAPANRRRIRFDVALRNKLSVTDLATPTFPRPPAGVTGILFFPFSAAVAAPQSGTAVPSTDWDGNHSVGSGAPFNFFNDFATCPTNATSDCYRWEAFPAPLAPGQSTAATTVGFDVPISATSVQAYIIVAADLVDHPPPPPVAQTGAIQGHITSLQLGALKDVAVQAGSRPPATTDMTGGYQLTGVPVGSVSVSLSALPAGCSNPAPATATVLAGGIATVDFQVTCPPPPSTTGTVTGSVTSPTLGNLYGVTVAANPGGKGAATDAAGSFAIPGVAAGMVSLTLGNLPTGCTNPGARSLAVVAGGSSIANFSVACTGAGATTGAVIGTVSTDGTPLPGVTITLQPGNLTANSDPAGVFQFGNVAPGSALLTLGSLPLICQQPGVRAVAIIAGQTTAVNYALTCPHGRITGVVTDLGGAPVAGTTVMVVGATADGHAVQSTGVSGVDGSYLVNLVPPGDPLVSSTGPAGCFDIQGFRRVGVAEGAATPLNITVNCPPEVSGTVSIDGEGFVPTGVTVEATPDAGGANVVAPVGSLGAYDMTEAPAGGFYIFVNGLPDNCTALGGVSLSLAQRAHYTKDFTVTCQARSSIEGVVRDLDDHLVAGAQVTIGQALAITNAAGFYRFFGVAPGNRTLLVQKPNICPEAPTGPVTVGAGLAITVNVRLDCPARVHGQISMGYGLAIPSGTEVRFIIDGFGLYASAPVTPSGTYGPVALRSSAYSVSLTAPGCNSFDQTITVAQQAVLSAGFGGYNCLPGGALRLRVTDGRTNLDPQPLAGVTVSLTASSSPPVAVTDQQGIALFQPWPSTVNITQFDANLVTTLPGCVTGQLPNIEVQESQRNSVSEFDFPVYCPGAGALAGRVHSDQGVVGLAGVHLLIGGIQTTTNENGEFGLGGLPPGNTVVLLLDTAPGCDPPPGAAVFFVSPQATTRADFTINCTSPAPPVAGSNSR